LYEYFYYQKKKIKSLLAEDFLFLLSHMNAGEFGKILSHPSNNSSLSSYPIEKKSMYFGRAVEITYKLHESII
jgi:hypothetical protein